MMKQTADFKVIQKRELGADDTLLVLKPLTGELPEILPGAFVNVNVENAPGTLLRRPISVCNVDEERGHLWLWVKRAGKGTAWICSLGEGDILNLLLPLGKGFSMPAAPDARVLLVGGGVGCAPLLYLAKSLKKRNIRPTILLGARSASQLHLLDEFALYGNLITCTEDGCHGVKGMVTDHPAMSERFDTVYCCGPTPMMKAVAAITAERGIHTEVSLEHHMACGFGVCLCCVQKDKNDHNVCVCTEGPVFNAAEIQL